MDNIRLIIGRSNPKLGMRVAEKLKIRPVACTLDDFANTELKVQINENIRGCDIFILQTGSRSETHSINDYFMELKLIAHACKLSSAKSISAVIPCYPYARSDKKDVPRVPITGSLVASELKNVGISRIICMDLHAGQIQGFTDVPFDNLYAIKLHCQNLEGNYFNSKSQDEINNEFILVSPDNGGIKRVESYAKLLTMDFIIMHKQRDYSQKSTVLNSMLIGNTNNLNNKTAIIIDDMVDTMGTMISAANELETYGVNNVIVLATHGILSQPAIKRINECEIISDVIITNTLPQDINMTHCNKIKQVDISGLLAKVIGCLTLGTSISNLFYQI